MGLYERLLQEAAELPENPNRERNERMSTYLKNLRRPVPEGGSYVTSEELEQEQQRYLTDIRNLHALLIHCRRSRVERCRLAHLMRKYPTHYALLRAIRNSYIRHPPDDGVSVPVSHSDALPIGASP